jgi:predicted ATPase
VQAFEGFRVTLRRELGMAPSAETLHAAEGLRTALTPAKRERPLPAALARPEHAPLVGRGEQLAALRSAWRRARAGAATVVALEGAAGSGKTRLLSEFAEELRAGGAVVLAGRCREDSVVAFAPFTEALRQHLDGEPDALPDWVAAELARLLPELAQGEPAPEGRPEDARHRLLEAVAAVIGQAARRAPVLLVVEDLHWADPATLQMLAHVIWTVGWAPLLVAGSIREEDAGPALDELLGELTRARRLERIALGGLTEAEAARLAGAWLG